MHLGFDPRGYETPDHPLQVMIARILSETCGVALEPRDMGIDGCSLPTYADAASRTGARFRTVRHGRGLAAGSRALPPSG